MDKLDLANSLGVTPQRRCMVVLTWLCIYLFRTTDSKLSCKQVSPFARVVTFIFQSPLCIPVDQCVLAGHQFARATDFCTVEPDVRGSSEWYLLLVTLLVPRILSWLLDFWKIRGPSIRLSREFLCSLLLHVGMMLYMGRREIEGVRNKVMGTIIIIIIIITYKL